MSRAGPDADGNGSITAMIAHGERKGGKKLGLFFIEC